MHLFFLSRLSAVGALLTAATPLVADSAPLYEVAFASFAPVNADIFLADTDGRNAKPWLPHEGFDGNASFSRDGAWIVFTSQRGGSFDIYRARLDGSDLERLVDDPAFDDQAALSPDGKSLAFVSSRSGQADIYVLDLSSKALRNVTNDPAGEFRPSWSHDGKWLAFTSERETKPKTDAARFGVTQSIEIHVMRPDGSDGRRITHQQTIAGSPRWSADDRQLIFYEAEFTESQNITAVARRRGTTQIAAVDLATGERRTLTTGSGEKWSPRWLDEGRVAYVSGGPEGGVEFSSGPMGARGEFRCPSWSVDGQQLVFQRDVSPVWPPFQRWHSRHEQFRLVRTGVFPAYSPQGDRLLCNDQPGAIVSKDLVMMNRDGTNRSVFFSGGDKTALAAVWSPDGTQVAFAMGRFFQIKQDRPAVADIMVVNRDGSDPRSLTDGSGNFGFPSWSPDGSQIVYRSSGKDTRGLFVMTLATKVVRELTPGWSSDNFPCWAPKGDRIVFTRYVEGNYDIFTIKPDGSDARRLTKTPGNDAHCTWSPDGEWIAFSSARGGFKDEAALHPYNAQPYGDIYVMRADGSDVRQLTDTPFEEGTVSWAPLPRRDTIRR